ncbi:tetratricopeptide repeat protein [Oceanicoccus sagamiensis]|uniref:Uncharacterized protein n=1 Tax=Oceanicoccus sagamiensis TaxID=716816 RepID=A0A1X9NAM3_9GAMM|nr:tetratricopeptide repeat protein [Oceanicoccus sagamiensis]ARN74104.1 hypothetical protein BST96_08195 [Oceanicoccus sagamiensis]
MARNNIKKIAGVSILSGMLLLTACGGGEERQEKYLSKAQEYFDQDNMDKAKIEVKNVMQINPKNPDAKYLMGLIDEKNKNFRGAFRQFSGAVELDATHIKSLNKVASYYLMSQDLVNAQESVDKVIALDANNADALASQAAIFSRSEENEKAIEKAQLALSIEPGHIRATTVLTAIYAQENPDLALDVISKGIESQSKNESLKYLKIRLLASQQKTEEVVALFQELIAEYPDNLMYVFQLVNYQIEGLTTGDNLANEENEETEAVEKRKDAAEKTLRDAIATNPDKDDVKLWLVEFLAKNRGKEIGIDQLALFVEEYPESFKLRDQLAQSYLNSDEVDKASALYQFVIDTYPEDTIALEARNRLVSIALSQNDREKANALLAEIFEIEPENIGALITRARLKLSENDIDGAIPDLRVVLKNAPESIQALQLIARAHEFNNSPDLALDNYQRLLAVQPKNMNALIGSSRLLIAKDQIKEALPILESAREIDPANPEMVRLLTDLYTREQRWDDALSTAAKLTENDKTMGMGYYLQGRVYLRQKSFEPAVDALKKSIETEPKGVETLSSLVGAYIALEQLDKAIAFVDAHVEKYPEQLHALELQANLYIRNGDITAATDKLNTVLEMDSSRNSAYMALARIYASQGKTDDIERLFIDGLQKNTDNSPLRLMLAEYYQTQKRFKDAIDVYDAILKDNPDAVMVKNNIASLLMDHFNTPENRTRIIDLASDLAATDNPAFLDTAGWAQYQQGNYPQAVSLLDAAIENGGKGPVYHYHLGMAYFKSDMKAQAKEQLEFALADDTVEFTGKEEAQSTLSQL